MYFEASRAKHNALRARALARTSQRGSVSPRAAAAPKGTSRALV